MTKSYIDRAITAYRNEDGLEQPGAESDTVTVGGVTYVRLINRDGLLAVYKVYSGDRVKRVPVATVPESIRPKPGSRRIA